MARIVMAGGGACGLLAAMLLAGDDHDVVVLERDGQEPPAPADAWDEWERRGVNQFRLPHGLIPRFRVEASRELPDLVERMIAEGAHEYNILGRSGPPSYQGVTGRRPFVETCIANEAAAMPGVEIRRGVAVAGLVAGRPAMVGTPHVTGVVLESGERIDADLVIDAGGRRSALPRWLEDIGAWPGIEEKEDSGFVYYGTHFRAPDGVQRSALSHRYMGSISVLSLAGENATWGVGIITASDDRELRCLKDESRWRNVVRHLPDSEHLLDGEALHEIRVMGAIEDRYRRYVIDGQPVATGVVAVADAVAATNPTLGRGISMGLVHVLALRDTLRKVGLDDPVELVAAFDEATETTLMPYYRDSVWEDRHRIAEVRRARTGEAAPADERWQRWREYQALAFSAGPGPMLERFLDWVMLRTTSDDILTDPEVISAMDAAGPIEVPGPQGPTRAELLSFAAG